MFGQRQGNPAEILASRAIPITIRESGCWIFGGALQNQGYGNIGMTRKNCSKNWLAHRFMWTALNGPIPMGLCVLHRCDMKPCINPAHLFLGTLSDNSRDMVRKNRHGFATHPERVPRGINHGWVKHPESIPRGEKHQGAKLTERDVKEIRAAHGPGMGYKKLAKKYAVTSVNIRSICKRKSWTHV